MKDVFVALRRRNLIEQVPGKRGKASAWRKVQPNEQSPNKNPSGAFDQRLETLSVAGATTYTLIARA